MERDRHTQIFKGLAQIMEMLMFLHGLQSALVPDVSSYVPKFLLLKLPEQA